MEDLKKRVVSALVYMLDTVDSVRYGDDVEFDFFTFREDLDEAMDKIEDSLDDEDDDES